MNVMNLLMILLLLLGCSDSSFKKYALLEDFRVLAIVADKPEISSSGETVSLTPIVSDIKNEGRSITVEIVACLDPGVSYGADIDCSGELGEQSIAYNSGNTVDLATSLGASVYTGEISSVNVTIPGDLISSRSIIEQYNGIDYLIIFKFSISGSVVLTSLKRIKISTNPSKNNNPTLAANSISFSEQTPALLEDEQRLTVTVSSGAETYSFYSLTEGLESTQEDISLSWFTSSGEISNSQINDGEFSKLTLASPLPSEAVISVLVRDGRGGISYQSVVVN